MMQRIQDWWNTDEAVSLAALLTGYVFEDVMPWFKDSKTTLGWNVEATKGGVFGCTTFLCSKFVDLQRVDWML